MQTPPLRPLLTDREHASIARARRWGARGVVAMSGGITAAALGAVGLVALADQGNMHLVGASFRALLGGSVLSVGGLGIYTFAGIREDRIRGW